MGHYQTCFSCGAEFTVEFQEKDFSVNFCPYCGSNPDAKELDLSADMSHIIENDDSEMFLIDSD